jgi:hypothetical protein
MHDLTKKMNVSILAGGRRFKSKEEKEEDPNPRKKKVMIHNLRKKHSIDGAICYGLHHKNYVQEKHELHHR